MAHTIGTISARTVSSGNPITESIVVAAGETLLVLMMVVTGATDRAGGAPTWGEFTLTQANTVQKAAASPEGSAELWYLLNPPAGTRTLTIPNTGALSIRYHVARAKAAAGSGTQFHHANGANATSTNPTVNVELSESGHICFSVVASGAQTWAPSARNGIQISDTDNGANGDGFQYLITETRGTQPMGWTFGTSDDWGVVAAAFSERPAISFNNYMFPRVGDGMGTTEKIR